ncbi:MAG TPA: hypothetical protein VN803_10375 [Gemmatimonadales bacterium]|nr:hypothetical protein [Gemmatimonadales bacterium]
MAEKAPKAVMKAVPLRLPMSLYSRLEDARGEMPRERWIRRAIEASLAPVEPAKPYRQSVPGPNVENIRSSAQAKGDFRPYPKGKR